MLDLAIGSARWQDAVWHNSPQSGEEANVNADVNAEEELQEEGTRVTVVEAAAGETTVAGEVTTGTVDMTRGSAQVVKADKVIINQGAAGRVEARFVDVKNGAIGIAHGENITVSDGAAGVVGAENVKIQDSFVLFAAANKIEGEDSAVLIDMRAAVVFALVLGAVTSLFKLMTHRRA